MIGVDTNLLVRYIVRDDTGQAARADRLLGARSSTDPAFVNRIVLCELVWVLRRAYRHDRGLVADVIERMLSTDALVVEDHEMAVTALALYREADVDFADVLIGLLNGSAGCEFTTTFDRAAPRQAGFRLA